MGVMTLLNVTAILLLITMGYRRAGRL